MGARLTQAWFGWEEDFTSMHTELSGTLVALVAQFNLIEPGNVKLGTLKKAINVVRRDTPEYHDALDNHGQIPGNGPWWAEVAMVYDFLSSNS